VGAGETESAGRSAISSHSLLRRLAGHLPAPLDGFCEFGAGGIADARGMFEVLRGVGIEGRDPEYIRRTLPLLRSAVSAYFRPEVRGLENIPESGPVLLVGNHSGGMLIADTFVFACEFYARFGPERPFHQLAHDVVVRVPYLGGLRRYGTVAASHANAEAAFAEEAAVLVYPGGDYETFRPSWESAEVDFGNRQGFLRLALRAKVPIVPVVSLGGQETALFVTRGERMARTLHLDRLLRTQVLPLSVGPPFGLTIFDLPARVPLPAKITISVLPPLDVRELARRGSDRDLATAYDRVVGVMQSELSVMQESRSVPVLG
jgi:1-acyl-sn-glycerol-3-phosphate acyltransferase